MVNSGKVYISGALMGSSDLVAAQARYEKFGKIVSEIGLTAYIPHQNTSPETNSNLTDDYVFKKDLENLDSSEILFVYVGEPSLGVGAEIALAIKSKKRIIAVFEEDQKVSRFITGYIKSHDQSNIIEYRNFDDLRKKLENLIMQSNKSILYQ